MKFRNMSMKYMNAAPAPEQGGGGGAFTEPALPPSSAPTPAPAPAPATAAAPVTAPPASTYTPVQQPAGMATVAQYAEKAGVPMEHIKAELDNYGKLSEVTLAVLRKVHGENTDLIAAVMQSEHATSLQASAEAEKAAHSFVAEQFGLQAEQGAQAMSELVTWAAQNMQAAELDEIANIIDGGGYAAKLALRDLAERFRKTSNVTPDVVTGAVPNVGTGTEMTRAEYNRQLHELEQKHGYNSPQVIALQRQRLAAVSRGN